MITLSLPLESLRTIVLTCEKGLQGRAMKRPVNVRLHFKSHGAPTMQQFAS